MTAIPVGTAKTIPANADRFALVDSADGNKLKDLTYENLRAAIKPLYGEMWFYESAGSQVITHTDQYYAINGEFQAGELDSFTFSAGSEGAGNITTAGGGAAININDAAHGLVTGAYVAVQSANHEGTALVTRIDAANFTVPIVYVGDEACTWQQGDYLLAGVNTAGIYKVEANVTVVAGAAAKNYKFELAVNEVHVDKTAFEITTSGTKDQSSSGGGFYEIAVGDRIYVIFKNETDAQDLDFEHANINLFRLSI